MKRGLITWDRARLPAPALEKRLGKVRKTLAERELPALVVYTDVWRSNQARFFTNFMPYWNRSLAVIPGESAPVLLCALSPRVYPWIRSVTVFEDIRPAGKLVQTLTQLCAERGWKKVGILDLPQLPHEIHSRLRDLEIVNVPSAGLLSIDEGELAMRRHAVHLARETLARHLPDGAGLTGHQFVGRLEREFRRAGAEDLIVHISSGDGPPAPATSAILGTEYSVAVALEYCGHWVKVIRTNCPPGTAGILLQFFHQRLQSNDGLVENLSGAYPYEIVERQRLPENSIFALNIEVAGSKFRLFYGDTCVGAQLL